MISATIGSSRTLAMPRSTSKARVCASDPSSRKMTPRVSRRGSRCTSSRDRSRHHRNRKTTTNRVLETMMKATRMSSKICTMKARQVKMNNMRRTTTTRSKMTKQTKMSASPSKSRSSSLTSLAYITRKESAAAVRTASICTWTYPRLIHLSANTSSATRASTVIAAKTSMTRP